MGRGLPNETAPRISNASLNSMYQRIPTPLSTLAVTWKYQLFPFQAEVDLLTKSVRGDTNTSYVAEVYPGDTNISNIKADRLTLIQRQPLPLVQNFILIHRKPNVAH